MSDLLGQNKRQTEQGSVLVIALIMIVLLTIIGISGTRNTEIEILIAGNERVAKENFYVAEAASADAIIVMEETDLGNDPPDWLMIENTYVPHGGGAALPASTKGDIDEYIHEDANWTDVYSTQVTALPGTARCLAIELGETQSGSLVMTQTKTYDFDVYGRSALKKGQGLVLMGYRKAM